MCLDGVRISVWFCTMGKEWPIRWPKRGCRVLTLNETGGVTIIKVSILGDVKNVMKIN
jgi:hypothetical protein